MLIHVGSKNKLRNFVRKMFQTLKNLNSIENLGEQQFIQKKEEKVEFIIFS